MITDILFTMTSELERRHIMNAKNGNLSNYKLYKLEPVARDHRRVRGGRGQPVGEALLCRLPPHHRHRCPQHIHRICSRGMCVE